MSGGSLGMVGNDILTVNSLVYQFSIVSAHDNSNKQNNYECKFRENSLANNRITGLDFLVKNFANIYALPPLLLSMCDAKINEGMSE